MYLKIKHHTNTQKNKENIVIERKGYIVNKSFRSYLTATILTLIIGQVCLTTDGIIMAHLVSPDALSAINLMSPFNMIMATIHALLAIGASVLAGKELGAQDIKKARQIFSVSIFSGLIAIGCVVLLCLVFLPQVVNLLCPEQRIQPYLSDYMQMYLFMAPISLLSVVLKLFVGVDGNPQQVTKASTIEGLLNVMFDILLVKFLGFGIEGSALATGIGQLATVSIMIWTIHSSRCRLAFEFNIPHWPRLLLANMLEGLPTMFGNLVLAAVALGINYIVMDTQGADGVFILSVCMQTLSIAMLALNGCGDTVFSIGSVMVGEHDMQGVRILSNKVFMITYTFTAVLSLLMLIWPDGLAMLFGATTDRWLNICRTPLREFSLMLVPLAIIMLSKFIYQLMGYLKFSSILSSGPFVLLLPALLLFGWQNAQHIWLAFPTAAVISFAGQLLAVMWLSRKSPDTHWFTLIPKESSVSNKMSISVAYKCYQQENVFQEVLVFLNRQGWSKQLQNRAMLIIEEISNNIYRHAAKNPRPTQYFDIHMFQDEDGVIRLIFKDDGILFNPASRNTHPYTVEELMTLSLEQLNLGLLLIHGFSSEINYQNMYGLNVTYISLFPEGYVKPDIEESEKANESKQKNIQI